MNTKLLTIIFGLAVLGSFGALYLSRDKGSRMPNFQLKDVERFSHLSQNELQYRMRLFGDWIVEHNKQYSALEAPIRFHAWNENYEFVQDHNSQNLSSSVEMNKFADLSSEEFASLYLGYNAKETLEDENVEYLDESNLAASKDWRDKAVTKIRDQGSCGSCYGFASAAALEGLRAIRGKGLEWLSTQEFVDCSGKYGNQGCNGGLMTNSFKYVIANKLAKESDYKYTGKLANCKTTKTRLLLAKGYQEVPRNNDKQLAAALDKQPVAVAVRASEKVFQLYKGGTITGTACGSSLDHAITAVGYTDSYWIVKNSWGGNWGIGGYVQIGRDTKISTGVCGILQQNSYPTF